MKALIDYTNWRGERGTRIVRPIRLEFLAPGSNKYHPAGGWALRAEDTHKQQERTFLLSGIHSWRDIDA